MYTNIHIPRSHAIAPNDVKLYAPTERHEGFASIEIDDFCLMMSPKQGRALAEELLRKLAPETIIGVIASAEETAAALEASRTA